MKIFDSVYYIAGGDAGVIVRTTTDGDSWNIVSNAAGFQDAILSLDFVDARNGMFCGKGGFIARTNDSGRTWSKIVSGTGNHLQCIRYLSPSTIIAVGLAGTMIRSIDSGKTFQPVAFESIKTLRTIGVIDSTTVIVCGADGFQSRSIDGGRSWHEEYNPFAHNLNSVDIAGNGTAVLAGEFGAIWLSSDYGKNWVKQKASPMGNCYAALMLSATKAIVSCDFKQVYSMASDGQDWANIIPSFGTEKLYGMSFAGKEGVIVGSNGIIMRTHNSGSDWEIIFDRVTPFISGLQDVYAFDSLDVVACGVGGLFVRSTDGGKVWKYLPTGTDFNLYGLHFVNRNIGYCVGELGTIIKTTDGGLSWTKQETKLDRMLRGVTFYDENNGIACGDRSTILFTSNGGNLWIQNYIPDSVHFFLKGAYLAPKTAVLVGFKVRFFNLPIIWRTEDGGYTWQNIDPPSNRLGIHYELYDVSFVSPLIGFASGSSGEGLARTGPFIYTLDGGIHWIESDSSISFPTRSLSFASRWHGTVVGINGKTAHTTDGGKSWNNVPSGTGIDLLGVYHPTLSTAFAVGLKTAILKLTTTDTYSSVKGAASAPVLGILGSIYPNPSQSVSTVSLKILEPVAVRMTLWDISGRKVRDLFNGYLPTGDHTLDIDVSTLRNGSYLLRLETVNGSEQTMIKVIR